jgi:UDP-N-acetylmuramoyl-tripeptide--D-alanyl-D-alanine ligase
LGKTTTKWFLYQLLKTKYKTATTSGSKNSQIGLALAIINESDGDEEYLVLEMGMSQKGQLSTLVQIAPPDIAVVTTLALVHAENFTTIEKIAEAKSEIMLHPSTRLALIHRDTVCYDILTNAGCCAKESYSLIDATASWRLEISESALHFFEKGEYFSLPHIDFPAPHLYNNLLVAIAVARHAGMQIEEIARVIPTLTLPEKRLQMVEKRGVCFINDSYNASELSMRAALDVLDRKQSEGRKIAILGHMRELGTFSEACHRNVGQHALPIVDALFCFGEHCGPLVEEWRRAGRPVTWYLQFEELLDAVIAIVKEGDLVLVKGARSLELERIVQLF